MNPHNSIKLFEHKKVRVQWVEEEQKWYFPLAQKMTMNKDTKRSLILTWLAL